MSPHGDEQPGSADRWIRDHLAGQRLRRVAPSTGDAALALDECRSTAKAAKRIADDAPMLALSGFHDATRKALTAHMTARGLAVENRPGAHVLVCDYAEEVLGSHFTEDELGEIRDLRADRNLAAYGRPPAQVVSKQRLARAALIATLVVETISRLLQQQSPR